MEKYVCVLSTDNYLEGVLVLNENLKALKSKYPLLCLINENISKETIRKLKLFHIDYKLIPSINFNCKTLYNWKYTFDKINVFSLTEYDKVVYLDSDFLILENIDHLFKLSTPTMASDVPFHADIFNSAVMIIKPNLKDYNNLKKLIKKYERKGITNIGDQNILNDYFKNTGLLNPTYNAMCVIQKIINAKKGTKYPVYYSTKGINNPKIIHYILSNKPFLVDKPYDDKYYNTYNNYLIKIREKLLKSTKLTIVINNINKDIKIKSIIKKINKLNHPKIKVIYLSKEKKKISTNITTITTFKSFQRHLNNADYVYVVDNNSYLNPNIIDYSMKLLLKHHLDWIQLYDNKYDFLILNKSIINESKIITNNIHDKIFKKEILLKYNNIEIIKNKSNKIGILKATNM